MNGLHDDEIETLLLRSFDGPVPDAGFSERVLRRLPRRCRIDWTLWGGLLVGLGASWLSLLHSSLLRAGWRDWLRGDWSTPAIVLLLAASGMALLACWWSAIEIGER